MAHEHAKDMIEAQEGTAGRQIKMTFLGGVLLVNSALAYLFFSRAGRWRELLR